MEGHWVQVRVLQLAQMWEICWDQHWGGHLEQPLAPHWDHHSGCQSVRCWVMQLVQCWGLLWEHHSDLGLVNH